MRRQATTQRDVARRAGVSQRLVSAVLHQNAGGIRCAPSTRERVLRAAAELGYRPNAVARSLVAGRTHTLGLIVGNLTNPAYAELVNHIHLAAAERGYEVMIALAEADARRPHGPPERLLTRRVDGLLVWSGHGYPDEGWIQRARAEGVPLVVMGDTPAAEGISYVAVDRAAGVEEAVHHLVRLGRRRLSYAGVDARGGRERSPTSKYAGFLRGLAAHNLRPHRVCSFDPLPWDADPRPLLRALSDQLARQSDRVDGLVVGGDMLAFALLGAFARAGVRVPEQVAVVGYDDVPIAALSVPSLTTLEQPKEALAREAVRLLLHQIAHPDAEPQGVALRPRLRIRESCGGAAGETASPALPPLLREELRDEVRPPFLTSDRSD